MIFDRSKFPFPKTKAEIAAWYKGAKYSLSLRLQGKHKSRPRLSPEDAEIYKRDIERNYKLLKRDFNERLKKREC